MDLKNLNAALVKFSFPEINIEDLSCIKISGGDINIQILNKIKPSTEIDLHLLIIKKIFKQ